VRKLQWIPDVLLAPYLASDEDTRSTEERLVDSMLASGETLDERASAIVFVVGNLSTRGLERLTAVLFAKKRASAGIGKLIELNTKGHVFEESRTNPVKVHIDEMSSWFPNPGKSLSVLQKMFSAMRSSEFVKALSLSTSPSTEQTRMQAAIGTVLKLSTIKDDEKALFHFIIRRVSFSTLSSSVLCQIAKAASEQSATEDHVRKCLCVLNMVASSFPSALVDSTPSLCALVHGSEFARDISETALRILSLCGQNLEQSHPALFRSIRNKMDSFCLTGTPRQAKYVIRLISIAATNAQVLLSGYTTQLESGLREGVLAATVLAACCELARFMPTVFSLIAEPVWTFCKERILGSPSASSAQESRNSAQQGKKGVEGKSNPAGIRDSSEFERPNSYVLARKYALKVGTLRALQQKEADQVAEVVAVMEAVVRKQIMTVGHINSSIMALSVAKCFFKLAVDPQVETLLPLPFYYAILSETLLHEEAYIRSHLLDYVWKLMCDMKLPIKYAALFAIGIIDPDEEVAHKAHTQARMIFANFRTLCNHAGVQLAVPAAQSLFPEYVVPPLVHMLCHIAGEVDCGLTARCLISFFEDLFAETSEGLGFILQMFQLLKRYDDVLNRSSNDTRMVCDVGVLAVQQIADGKTIIPSPGNRLFLYTSMYVVSSDPVKKANANYLPADFQMPKRPKNLNVGPSAVSSALSGTPGKATPGSTPKGSATSKSSANKARRSLSTSKRRSKALWSEGESEEEDAPLPLDKDEDEEEVEDAPARPSSGQKRGRPAQAADEDEDEDESKVLVKVAKDESIAPEQPVESKRARRAAARGIR
jgi:hypothetical protein